jgi:predicted nucleic acid-binding protein
MGLGKDTKNTRNWQRLPLPDAAIAASAELSGCTLVTRNTRDFEGLAGTLAIEFYSNEL